MVTVDLCPHKLAFEILRTNENVNNIVLLDMNTVLDLINITSNNNFVVFVLKLSLITYI